MTRCTVGSAFPVACSTIASSLAVERSPVVSSRRAATFSIDGVCCVSGSKPTLSKTDLSLSSVGLALNRLTGDNDTTFAFAATISGSTARSFPRCTSSSAAIHSTSVWSGDVGGRPSPRRIIGCSAPTETIGMKTIEFASPSSPSANNRL